MTSRFIDGWPLKLQVLLAVAALLFVVSACTADSSGDGATRQPAEPPAEAEPVEFDIELGDLYVSPNNIEVPAGAPVILNVTNAGALPHDLVVRDGPGTRILDPGESESVTVGPFTGNEQMICTIPGHEAAGMVMDVVVTDAQVAEPGATNGHDGQPAPTGAGYATVDPNAQPDADWQPFDPVLEPAPDATVHQVTFRMTETQIEVAPGVTQELWTFEDQVPGPVLRGKVGDIFEVTIVNEGRIPHSIDFHASKVAWNVEMRDVMPGDSLEYRFEAKHAGIFMYHCGTAPALHHIGNGMYGAIIIDPPDLEPVDHEFVFVQSEYYLGPEGEPGDLRKMQNDEWDLVVFNGYFNQYLYAPIRIEADERVRAWVLNVGPSENSSFHIVGTIFDTVYKEGTYRLRPDELRGGAQAIDLQPAQGGFVEFTMDVDGLYPIVTHKFSNVGKGALGLFQAGDVETEGAAH
jgi:nitrite reductase (NO-forming)